MSWLIATAVIGATLALAGFAPIANAADTQLLLIHGRSPLKTAFQAATHVGDNLPRSQEKARCRAAFFVACRLGNRKP